MSAGSMPAGRGGRVSEDEAIRGIEARKWDFYTHVDGRTADVIIAVHLWIQVPQDETRWGTPR